MFNTKGIKISVELTPEQISALLTSATTHLEVLKGEKQCKDVIKELDSAIDAIMLGISHGKKMRAKGLRKMIETGLGAVREED